MSNETQPQSHTLLICTLGGSPDPIKFSFDKYHPEKIIFLASSETAPCRVDGGLQLGTSGPDRKMPVCINVAPASYEVKIAKNHQSTRDCVEEFSKLAPDIRKWTAKSDDQHAYEVVVDFTGGTKAMSAALALCARVWKCRLAYVGGTQREKGGVGVVATGSEYLVEESNPWEVLGFQAVEEFVTYFNAGNFAAARELAEDNRNKADANKPSRQRFSALAELADGYWNWEAFQHGTALQKINMVFGRHHDPLAAALTPYSPDPFFNAIQCNLKHLQAIDQNPPDDGGQKKPSLPLIADLLSNAQRRGMEGRYEDAVARLYRAVEAIAQWQLLDKYHITAGAVRPDQLPRELQYDFGKASADGLLKLALQDCYKLLKGLKDPAGGKFYDLKLNENTSPLSNRNNSILAHGFQPANKGSYDSLSKPAHELWQALGNAPGRPLPPLPQFPKIGEVSA